MVVLHGSVGAPLLSVSLTQLPFPGSQEAVSVQRSH